MDTMANFVVLVRLTPMLYLLGTVELFPTHFVA